MEAFQAVTPKSLAVLWGLVLGVIAGAVSAVPAQPVVPYEHHGACPFECCTYRTWIVKVDTDVRTDRRDSARVAFRVRRREHVEGITGVVVTTKLGMARVQRPTVIGPNESSLKIGEVVYILHSLGEGFWHVWIKGQIDSARVVPKDHVCSQGEEEAGECAIRMIEEPKTVWWAKVRNHAGREGWTRDVDRFGEVDACG